MHLLLAGFLVVVRLKIERREVLVNVSWPLLRRSMKSFVLNNMTSTEALSVVCPKKHAFRSKCFTTSDHGLASMAQDPVCGVAVLTSSTLQGALRSIVPPSKMDRVSDIVHNKRQEE